MEKERKGLLVIILFAVVIVILIAAIAYLMYSVTNLKKSLSSLQEDFNLEKSLEKRVVFTLEQSEVRKTDAESLCKDICSKGKYDGYESGELIHEATLFIYECKCYMTVR